MLIFKYMMLVTLFVLSTLVGRYISKQYYYRLNELEEIKESFNIIKTKIKFTNSTIPEIFEEISETSKSNISKLFKTAKEKMSEYSASV